MSALSIESVVAQLAHAGLSLSLAPVGGLAVTPSRHITPELRALIRSSKPQLIDWLTAANDATNHAPDPPDNPVDWKELAAAYHTHHFTCPTCIAAGRGSRYGLRCGVGSALWRAWKGSRTRRSTAITTSFLPRRALSCSTAAARNCRV